MELTETTRVRQCDRIAARVYDGCAEVITLDEPVRQHRLNRVGTRIWELAATGRTLAAIAREVAAHFIVDEARAHADARAFCEDLLRRGILELDEPASGAERAQS